MSPQSGILILAVAFTASRVMAAQLDDVGDPVRNAQRMEDCMAQYAETAKGDAATERQIANACIKAINDGSFRDKNISLDGMIKSPRPAM
jgi:hypothetical protein